MGGPTMTPLEALQATLSGEHAAVYLFGVFGGQVSQSRQPDLFSAVDAAYEVHVHQRDRLSVLVTRHHGVAAAAKPSYRLPGPVGSPAQVRATALLVETRCLPLYGQLVGSTSGADRAWGVTALTAGSVRVLGFGGSPTDFPGLASP